jgi:uncharacterized protein (DUF58 family)
VVSLLPVIIAVFLLASIVRVAFIYHVLYVLLAVALLARGWASLVARRLTLERTFPERALNGESAHVELKLRNGSPLPMAWLRLHDRLPVELSAASVFDRAVSLGPGGEATFSYELHCRQRGWYRLGPASVETGDVLGLNLFRREFHTDRRLLVYPKILTPSALGLSSRTPFGDVRTRQTLYEDPARAAGVRDYQPGDSQRSIHWRTSAALGRLQVRKLEPAMTLRTMIALDLNLGAYGDGRAHYATELAIVVAASMANDLVSRRQEIGLLSNGRDPAQEDATRGPVRVAPRKGRDQLTRVLDVLARVRAEGATPIDTLLTHSMGDLSWGATVVVITGDESASLRGALTRLRRAGFALSVVVINQVSPYREGGALGGLGVPVHYVWRESDIDDVGEPGPRRRPAQLAAV